MKNQENNMNFTDWLNAYVQQIDCALDHYLSVPDHPQKAVSEAMLYSVQAGGKRIRPVLTLEFCRILGGNIEHALPFACAVEMIHSSSLIHDDLPCMDNDMLRRGKPSCHIAFGEANALLAGDALLFYAFEVIAKAPMTHKTDAKAALQALAALASLSGIEGMVGGQVIDLAYEEKPINKTLLNELNRLKTAKLIQASCQLGAIAAGADEVMIKKAGTYGETLGLAFQICDDILDVTGDEKTLGKPIGSDEQNKKSNYITLYGIEESQKKAEELTKSALNQLAEFSDIQFLSELTMMLLNRNH